MPENLFPPACYRAGPTNSEGTREDPDYVGLEFFCRELSFVLPYNLPMRIERRHGVIAMLWAATGVFCAPAAGFAADAKADLAPTGTLRGIFLGRNPAQATRTAGTGDYTGPVPDMLKEIARQIGVPSKLIPGEDAAAVMDAVNGHTADIGFLAYDDTRARVVDFSAPFYLMFNAYLVRADSPFQNSADVDRPGTKVGATTGQTQQIFLSETLKRAKVISMEKTPPEAEMARMLQSGEIDAFGQNRERSEAAAAKFATLRVLKDNFSSVGQSIVVAKGETPKLAHLKRLLNAAIASGRVQASLDRAKLVGVGVAPLGK
jgi:polar amino acid transport system substrate-binding protein